MPLTRFSEREVGALLGRASCIYPVTEEVAARAAAYGLQSRWNDDDSDYTYDSRRLASLEGKALRAKRMQAAAFAAAVRPSCAPLGRGNLQQALDTLELWAGQVAESRIETDYDQCREALCNFDVLGLTGLVVSDSAESPCAFLLAQSLGESGVAVHFAKGNRNYAGVYAYMFSQFAARCGAARLNFEQDLGKPGLRRAKLAFDPVERLHKCRLFIPSS
jgi:hypothetical protein